MRLAIDASRTVVPRITGTEHYAIELIRALLPRAAAHRIDITLYFRDPPPPDLFPPDDQVTHRVIAQRYLWTQGRFAAALWRDRPDLTWVPAHTLPLLLPGRAAVTVHDLGFRYFPEAHPLVARTYLEWMTPYSARRANVVLVDSHATGADLQRFYRINPGKIHVVYPGVTPPPAGDVRAMRAKYGLPDRYWLFIGTLQPRKNIARIVAAYARWRAACGDDSTALVLAGGQGWLFDPAWTAGVDSVILPGYIDDADKGALYAGALGLVFPSLYEGFGFPVIEALHCGTPVICSDTSSLPELAGDAALLVDPLDIGAIATAMTQLSESADRRATLRERGSRQAQRFTWDAAAEATLSALAAAARSD